MNKFAVFVFLSGISLSILATDLQAQDSEWTLFKEVDGVEIYQKSTNCHDLSQGYHRRHILLRFVNTTDQDLKITWFDELWYDGNCLTCVEPEDPEHFQEVELAAGETVEGSCALDSERALKVFETFLTPEGEKLQDDVAELSQFDLHRLTIEPM